MGQKEGGVAVLARGGRRARGMGREGCRRSREEEDEPRSEAEENPARPCWSWKVVGAAAGRKE